jgi:septum formation protein
MSDREIEWYVATGEGLDKAGAYAVQGKAALFIEGLSGSHSNVIGLPVRLLYVLAGKAGIDLTDASLHRKNSETEN